MTPARRLRAGMQSGGIKVRAVEYDLDGPASVEISSGTSVNAEVELESQD